MKNIDLFKQLVDDKAIEFIRQHDKEYDKSYNTFLNSLKGNYIIGIDLSNAVDRTYIPPIK